MAKITITHEFEFYEERYEINHLMNSYKYYTVLNDIDAELKNMIKHGEHEWLTEDVVGYLESLREQMWEAGVFADE